MNRTLRKLILSCLIPSCLGLLALTVPAFAHPHVWVAMRSEVLFDDGKVVGVRHHWVFDEMYSSFAVTGVGAAGAQLSDETLLPIAQTNVEQLEEYQYFTSIKMGGKKLEFAPAKDYSIHQDEAKILTLHFTVPLKAPVPVGKFLALQIYDPSYFVAFSFVKDEAVKLVNAPAGCSLSVSQPKALEETETKKLNESFFSGLSPGADFGIKLADRAIVACP